jgi:DNA polymerase (family 10)
MIRQEAEEAGAALKAALDALEGVQRTAICGSYRRGCEDMKDLDVVVQGPVDSRDVANTLSLGDTVFLAARRTSRASAPAVNRVASRGNHYIEGVFGGSTVVNIWFIESPAQWGAMLLFATGAGGFNIALRARAKARGFLLNRYGLWSRDDTTTVPVAVAGVSEGEIFAQLGMRYVEPEERTEYFRKRFDAQPGVYNGR